MAVGDLSSVTKILRRLLNLTVEELQGGTPQWTVSAAPPDPEGTEQLVHVHLFHIHEEAHRRNFPPPFEPPFGGSGPSPVSLTPLALSLYYVITPVGVAGTGDPSEVALTRQRILGQIAKAIHDYPVLDTDTEVVKSNGTTEDLFDGTILGLDELDDGDRIELILRPLKPEDAVTFWSSEQTQTPPPSVYLEARVALLPPQKPSEISGIVLTVGSYIFVGFPQLVRTRSVVTVVPPTTNQPMPIQAVPARVSIFSSNPSAVSPEKQNNNLLIIDGANISAATRKLVLSGPGDIRVVIRLDDPLDSPEWAPMFPSTGLTVRVWQNPEDDETNASVKLVPGAYTARVAIVDQLSGQSRTSNSVPLLLTPEMAAPAQTANTGTQTTYAAIVEGDLIPAFDGTDEEEKRKDIELVVAGAILDAVADGSPPGPGEWEHTFDVPSNKGTITFTLLNEKFGTPAQPLPVMLVINGVTSPVVWAPVPVP